MSIPEPFLELPVHLSPDGVRVGFGRPACDLELEHETGLGGLVEQLFPLVDMEGDLLISVVFIVLMVLTGLRDCQASTAGEGEKSQCLQKGGYTAHVALASQAPAHLCVGMPSGCPSAWRLGQTTIQRLHCPRRLRRSAACSC